MDNLLINAPVPNVQGYVRMHHVVGDSWQSCSRLQPNLVLFQWAKITTKLLTSGLANYRIGGMYLEFENVASPGDTVTPPAFNRTRDINYYNNLSASATKDYLRVPMTATQVLSEGEGLTDNLIIFFARSSGVVGVHGKAFSDAYNSTIYGISLVAFPDVNDVTQDLLFSSHYFDSTEQKQKESNSQIGIEWQLVLQ